MVGCPAARFVELRDTGQGVERRFQGADGGRAARRRTALGGQFERSQHAVAHEFQHLPTARFQRLGHARQIFVEQVDQLAPVHTVTKRREPAEIAINQHGGNGLDMAPFISPFNTRRAASCPR